MEFYIHTTQRGNFDPSKQASTSQNAKNHLTSNDIVADLRTGHPTQLIKVLVCSLPLEETRTAYADISTRSTSPRADGHLWTSPVLTAHRKAKLNYQSQPISRYFVSLQKECLRLDIVPYKDRMKPSYHWGKRSRQGSRNSCLSAR